MQLVLDDVRVQGRRGSLLELDHLDLATGECVLVAGEPGQGHTALALTLTGRLAPAVGRVCLVHDDDSVTDDPREVRRVSAIVDLPSVSEPDDEVPVGAIVGEDLALAHQRVWPGRTTRWLAHLSTGLDGTERIDELPGRLRTAVLTALASERPAVRFLLLTLPDRHGGDPRHWWSLAQAYAAAGYGVLVQCTRPSARELGVVLDPTLDTTPVVALRLRLGALPPTPGEDRPAHTHRADDRVETPHDHENGDAR